MKYILIEYLSVNIWILFITVYLWINDGEFSAIDHKLILLFAVAGMIHIRMTVRDHKLRQSDE